jgi:hypothetical protein
MDDILQAQFERVEQALGALVDSIASYNPNPQAAIDLVTADDELSHGLDQRMQLHSTPKDPQLTQDSRQTPGKPCAHSNPSRRG